MANSHSWQCARLVEDHRLRDVEEHPPLSDPFHRSRQNLAFNIGAFLDQILRAHTVVDAGHTLLDDGALVQVSRNEMRRRTDDLDAALVCLVVGLGSLEGWQKAVVDVDDLPTHGLAQHRRQDLHVAGQDDQLNVVLPHQLEDLALLLRLGVLGDGEMVELDAVAPGQGLELGVVRHDDGDLDPQLARLGPEQQVVEAVPDLGHHDEHAGFLRHRPDLVVHMNLGGQGLEGRSEGVYRRGGPKVDAHEELVGDGVGELLQVYDVDIVGGEDAGDRVNDAGLVRTGQRKYVIIALRGCHVERLVLTR